MACKAISINLHHSLEEKDFSLKKLCEHIQICMADDTKNIKLFYIYVMLWQNMVSNN